MITFAEYTTLLKESKFRELAPEFIKQVKRIANIYYTKFRATNKTEVKDLFKRNKIIDIKTNTHWIPVFKATINAVPTFFNTLGSVTVFDKETKKNKKIQFIVVYGTGSTVDEFASYSESFEVIILHNDALYDQTPERIEQIVLHELIHGFQEYKGQSSEYSKNIEDQKNFDPNKYFPAPVEFDTHSNEISYLLRERYKQLQDFIKKSKDPVTKRYQENRLEKFLLQLRNFIKSRPDVYFKYKELPIPEFFANHDYFLSVIQNHRELWEKLKLKLTILYKELTGEDIKY